MKKTRKVLSLMLALSLALSIFTGLAVTINAESAHGEYLSFNAIDAQGTMSNGATITPVTNQGAASATYDAATDSYNLVSNAWVKNARACITPQTAIPKNKYKYAKILSKYNNANNIGYTIDTYAGSKWEDKLAATQYVSPSDSVNWKESVFELGENTADITKLYFFFVWNQEAPATSTVSTTNTLNYIALFENEADAIAYDNSIKSVTIAGLNGVIDPIEHTITIDVPLYADRTTVESATPVVTYSPLASGTPILDGGEVTGYTVTKANGETVTYTFTINYPEEITRQGEYLEFKSTDAQGTMSNGATITPVTNQGAASVTYVQATDSYDLVSNGWVKNARALITPQTAIPKNKYKYAKILAKYDNANNVGYTVYPYTSNYEGYMSDTQYVTADTAQAWKESVFAIPEMANDIAKLFYFFVWNQAAPATSNVSTTNTLNYMVLFEDEDDANAYDNSIKGVSIAGLNGVIDPVEHTITVDVPLYVNRATVEASTPVVTYSPLASGTPILDNNNKIISYDVVNAAGRKVLYRLKVNYAEAITRQGEYIEFKSTDAQGTMSNGATITPVTNQGATSADYDAATDSYNLVSNAWVKNARACITPQTAIPKNKYKYAKVLSKYNNANDVGYTIMTYADSKYEGIFATTTQYVSPSDSVNWKESVFELGENTADITRLFYFFVWNQAAPATQTVSTTSTLNYMVLFENEDDANAYDNSIKSVSIAGVTGVIDPVEHTITFDAPKVIKDIIESSTPVITYSPLASGTPVLDTNSKVIGYDVINATGKKIFYGIKVNYSETITRQGDYIDFRIVDTQGALSNGRIAPITSQGCDSADYDLATDSYKLVPKKDTWVNNARVMITPNANLAQNKYKYAKILAKYSGVSNINYNIDLRCGYTDTLATANTVGGTAATEWRTTIFPLPETAGNVTEIAYFFVTSSGDSVYNNINYLKYLALFEDEDDAENYDASIKSCSINGLKGKINGVSHEIVFDIPWTRSIEEFGEKSPVMIMDGDATAECLSDTINYIDDIVYRVTDIFGNDIYYTVKFNYEKRTDNSIISARLSGINAVVDGTKHTVTFDFTGNDAVRPKTLKDSGNLPVFTMASGATIEKISGTPNFRNDIKYTVTDANGRKINYSVKFVYSISTLETVDGTEVDKDGSFYEIKHNATGENATLFLAVYDNEGRLEGIQSRNKFENVLSAKFDTSVLGDSNHVAKAYIWDKSTLKPYDSVTEMAYEEAETPEYDRLNTKHEQWQAVPLVSQAQKDAGFTGGEGSQVISWVTQSRDGNTMMFFTDYGGTYISKDRGENWIRGGRGVNSASLGNGEIDPNNSSRVIAVTYAPNITQTLNSSIRYSGAGLYLSNDTGYSYNQVMALADKTSFERQAFAWDPTSYDDTIGGSRYCYFSTMSATPINQDYQSALDYQIGQGKNSGLGLYRSSDGGATWELVNANYGGCVVAVSEADGSVFVANETGLYRSTDHGVTFTKVINESVGSVTTIPTQPNNVYASVKTGIKVSTNNGATFGNTIAGTNFPSKSMYSRVTTCNLRVSPVNPNYMLIADMPNQADVEGRTHDFLYYQALFVSKNGGTTWTKTTYDNTNDFFVHQNRYKMALWDTEDDDIAWSVSDWMERSTDGGSTFSWYNNGYNGACINSPFIPNVYNPNRYLVPLQDFTGAYTLDGGRTFTSLHQAAHTTGTRDVVKNHVYGGYIVDENTWFFCTSTEWEPNGTDSQCKLVITHDGGETYVDIGTVGSSYSHNLCLQSQVEPNVYFAGDMMSLDGGYDWSKIGSDIKCIGTYNPYGNEIFALSKSNGKLVYVSRDAGRTWSEYMTAEGSASIYNLAYDGINGILYYTQADYVSKFQNNTITKLNCGVMKDRWRTSLAIDPNHPEIIYTGGIPNGSSGFTTMDYTRSIFRSCDGGETWQVISSADIGVTGSDSVVPFGTMVGNYYTWAMFVHPETGELYAGMPCFGLYKFAAPYNN